MDPLKVLKAVVVLVLIVGFTAYWLPMRRRWKAILLIVVGYYVCAFIGLGIYKDMVPHPLCSCSIAEAKSRGSFISEARFEPMNAKWQGSDLEFDEVWIEEAMETKTNVLLLPYEKGKGSYFLCFSLKSEPSNTVLFVVEGQEDTGFAWTKGAGWKKATYNADISFPEIFDLRVYVQKSWHDKERCEISIRRGDGDQGR